MGPCIKIREDNNVLKNLQSLKSSKKKKLIFNLKITVPHPSLIYLDHIPAPFSPVIPHTVYIKNTQNLGPFVVRLKVTLLKSLTADFCRLPSLNVFFLSVTQAYLD